jgi:peptide-methionine (R)-S-oxide reductase
MRLATMMILFGLLLGGCDRNNRPDAKADSPASGGDESEAMAATGAKNHGMAGAKGVEGDPTARPVPPVGTSIEVDSDTWKEVLTDEQFYVLREEGTERAFTGILLDVKEPGVWHCAGCNAPLFETETKFKSGTGWPSFYAPIEGRVAEKSDNRFGMVRTEVHCKACGGHLGHVFKDGPEPTGLRYCINSVSLNFRPEDLPQPPEGVAPELKPTE